MKARAKQLGQSGKLVFHEKVIDEEGSITELKIWQVPKSTDYPEGLRYRCAYVLAGEKAPAVLYDLHRGKSHHRHFEGIEQPYRFESVRKLIQDFRTDVDRIKTAKRGTGTLKTFEIRIKTTRKALEDFARTFEELQAGKHVERRKGVFFTSVEAARNLLTPERIKLLTVIHEREPESIYQLARMCDRDLKNVHEDVRLLEKYGILETRIRRAAGRAQRVPRVPYDEINLRIPLAAQAKFT